MYVRNASLAQVTSSGYTKQLRAQMPSEVMPPRDARMTFASNCPSFPVSPNYLLLVGCLFYAKPIPRSLQSRDSHSCVLHRDSGSASTTLPLHRVNEPQEVKQPRVRGIVMVQAMPVLLMFSTVGPASRSGKSAENEPPSREAVKWRHSVVYTFQHVVFLVSVTPLGKVPEKYYSAP